MFKHIADTLHVNRFPALLQRFSAVRRVLIDYKAYSRRLHPAIQWSCFSDDLRSLEIFHPTKRVRTVERDNSEYIVSEIGLAMAPNVPISLDAPKLRQFRHLTILKGDFSLLEASLSDLPRTLLVLDNLNWSPLKLNGRLPPALTRLGITLEPRFCDWQQLFEMLPQIDVLRMSPCRGAPACNEVALEDWKSLPRSLRDCEWKTLIRTENLTLVLGSLPPMLKRLAVSSMGARYPFPPIPKTLTVLEGANFEFDTADQVLDIPRSLTSISVSNFHPDKIALLPPNLTDLTVFGPMNSGLQVDPSTADPYLSVQEQMLILYAPHIAESLTAVQHMKALPLKKLVIDLWYYPIAELRNALPSSLEFLQIHRYNSMQLEQRALDSKDLEDLFGDVSVSPPLFPHLKEVVVGIYLRGHDAIKYLPRSLTLLNYGMVVPSSLETATQPCSVMWSSWLPRGLKRWRLDIFNSEALTKASRSATGFITEPTSLLWQHVLPAWFNHFPTTLVQLEAVTTHFGADHMKALAQACPSLIKLTLSISIQLRVQWLENLTDELPKSLRRFELFFYRQDKALFSDKEDSEYLLPSPDTPTTSNPSHQVIPMNIIDGAFGRLPRGLAYMKLSSPGSLNYSVSPLPDNAPLYLCVDSSDKNRVIGRPKP